LNLCQLDPFPGWKFSELSFLGLYTLPKNLKQQKLLLQFFGGYTTDRPDYTVGLITPSVSSTVSGYYLTGVQIKNDLWLCYVLTCDELTGDDLTV